MPTSKLGAGDVPCAVERLVLRRQHLYRRRQTVSLPLGAALARGRYTVKLFARDAAGRTFGPYRRDVTA
jgi:hypothetical protein